MLDMLRAEGFKIQQQDCGISEFIEQRQTEQMPDPGSEAAGNNAIEN